MIYAYSPPLPGKLVSEPVVFLADKDCDDITIQLQEGILVKGTAMFDDDTSAAGWTIAGSRPVTPLVSADDVNVQINFMLEFQTPVQANGKFELYLLQGDWQLTEPGETIDLDMSNEKDVGQLSQ